MQINKKRRWDAILEHLPAGRVFGAEVGVWQGSNASQLLSIREDLFLYLVDRWCATPPGDSYFGGSLKIARMAQHELDAAYNLALRKVLPYKNRCQVMKMESAKAAELVSPATLDFVFIDADHSYLGVCTDIKAWLPKVKPGGWLCGHDYDHPEQGEVKRAVHELLGDNIEISYNRTWFYRVPGETA